MREERHVVIELGVREQRAYDRLRALVRPVVPGASSDLRDLLLAFPDQRLPPQDEIERVELLQGSAPRQVPTCDVYPARDSGGDHADDFVASAERLLDRPFVHFPPEIMTG